MNNNNADEIIIAESILDANKLQFIIIVHSNNVSTVRKFYL